MYLVDYHIHSSCSFDCEFTMLEMAKAAYKRDIKELCFTDHLEVTGELGMLIGPEEFELPEKQAKQYAACLESAPIDMKIGLGLELEHIGDDPARAKRIYGMPEYDFVLGAVHRLRGYEDFYFINYLNREQCFDLLDKYLDELIEMVEIGAFDSVAHIGYCARYMYRDKINVTLEYHDFPEKIDALLGLVIEKGKGIELNCSNLFEREGQTLKTSFPSAEILARYKELGGDIVTIGSDSHSTDTAGLGIKEGMRLLYELGFNYFTVFKKHKPEFIRIEGVF
jgi:histidinol-phosphatase (PHP family)